MNITVDCSPEQLDVIEDHLLYGAPLGVQPDERHWMLAQARKQYPSCRITKADLDIANGTWNLTITI